MSAAAGTVMDTGMDTLPVTRHRWYEDLQALVTVTLFVALGVVMFALLVPEKSCVSASTLSLAMPPRP